MMRPQLKILDPRLIDRILDQAREVLKKTGFELNHAGAVSMLTDHGARLNGKRIFLNDDIIDKSLAIVAGSFALFDRDGEITHRLEASKVHFAPGSSAVNILELDSSEIRPALSADYIKYARTVDHLPALAAQSTAFIPSDVPVEISDSFRLYLSLIYSKKPVITGTFRPESFALMKDLQLIVRGSQSCLEESPLTVFSCCPASPLKWEFDSVQTLLDCAESAIPIELISTPLIGLVSPVTPVGTLIQHTAENLSGLVIAQMCRKGTPILYGGAPSFFDIRYETTPVSPPEVVLIQCAINEIGKYLGLPTQAYLAVSDSKSLDVQAGLETSMGAAMAVLSGINSVSGPGLLEYLNTFSIEKLILDNELCSLSQRLSLGISELRDIPIEPILGDLMEEGHLLISEHTRKNLSAAHYLPGPIIDHMDRSRWKSQGSLTLKQRLDRRLLEILETSPTRVPDDAMIHDLRERMQFEAKEFDMDILPDGLDL